MTKTQKNSGLSARPVRNLFVVGILASVALAVGTVQAQSHAPQDHARYEAWLNKQVHHRLATLPWYGVFDNLEYRIRGSEVILYGEVVRPVTKSDAAGALKGLEGVTRLVNNIQVLPPSPFDDHIRRAEYRAIFSEPSLSRYAMGAIPSIHIIVDHGRVMLFGVVDNNTDRNLATLRAKGVPDVFSVTNHLCVA